LLDDARDEDKNGYIHGHAEESIKMEKTFHMYKRDKTSLPNPIFLGSLNNEERFSGELGLKYAEMTIQILIT